MIISIFYVNHILNCPIMQTDKKRKYLGFFNETTFSRTRKSHSNPHPIPLAIFVPCTVAVGSFHQIYCGHKAVLRRQFPITRCHKFISISQASIVCRHLFTQICRNKHGHHCACKVILIRLFFMLSPFAINMWEQMESHFSELSSLNVLWPVATFTNMV